MAQLSTWLTEASTVIQAITPLDRPQYRFREVQSRRDVQGHREFRWARPLRGNPELMNASASFPEWSVDLEVLIKSFGRGGPQEVAAIANDTDLIARAIERRTQGGSWTSTPRGVIQEGPPDLEELDNGDTLATFTFLVQTAETA